jgi:hypothetical protein
MRTLRIFIAIVFFLWAASFVLAQETPKSTAKTTLPAPITLTEAEQKEVTDAFQSMQTHGAEMQAALERIKTCKLEPTETLRAVAEFQVASERAAAAEKLAGEILKRHNLAHQVKNHFYEQGLKTLIPRSQGQ